MKNYNLNKTICEELFGGELDVMEETPDPFETDKSQVRQYGDWLHERNEKQLEILKKVESALEKVESFSRTSCCEVHAGTRKRIREPTVSPKESGVKKPVEKRPKASNKEEEWVQVSIKKDLR